MVHVYTVDIMVYTQYSIVKISDIETITCLYMLFIYLHFSFELGNLVVSGEDVLGGGCVWRSDAGQGEAGWRGLEVTGLA